MRLYKLLSIFCLFSTCTAPVRAYFDGFGSRRGETEFSVEEWQGFVDNPIEGRARLREVCGGLVISDNIPCLEFRFGDLTDPQPAEDSGTVIVSVAESVDLKIRMMTLSDRSNLEIDMKTTDTSGIVFYLQGNDEFRAKCGLRNYCATYFKDCLHEVREEDLQLVRILFYKGEEIFGGYGEGDRSFNNYGISGHFTPQVFNSFRANGEILTQKVFEVFSGHEQMPSDFKTMVFNTTWCKISKVPYNIFIQYLGVIIATRAVGGLPTFIHHVSEVLNTLNPIPDHPKLEFPEGTTEHDFGDLFKGWYEYGLSDSIEAEAEIAL